MKEGKAAGIGLPAPASDLSTVKTGITMKIIGKMKMYINSCRRVKDFRSFRIMAASIGEKPSFPKSPVFGVYSPWDIFIDGSSYMPNRMLRWVAAVKTAIMNAVDDKRNNAVSTQRLLAKLERATPGHT